ncbi:MAG: hypothetical protein R2702_16145 [Acidimicrobiales bacterium]
MHATLLDWVGFATTDEDRLAAALERHRSSPRPVEAAALHLLREAWSEVASADRPAVARKVRLLERELDRTPMPLGEPERPTSHEAVAVAG